MTFDELMNGFGVVTAMDLCIWTPKHGYSQAKDCCNITGGALTPDDFNHDVTDYIDTMKITNINQEGPTKTITGGRFATPILKYGKTTTLEATDALGRASTLKKFFGAKYVNSTLEAQDYKFTLYGDAETTEYIVLEGKFASPQAFETATVSVKLSDIEPGSEITAQIAYDAATAGAKITLSKPAGAGNVFIATVTVGHAILGNARVSFDESFPGPFAIQGVTEFVDKNGQKKPVYIFIPQFYPNGIFNLTQDTEGDAAVFDLGGTIIPTTIKDSVSDAPRTIFYEIREKSFFQK